jgi:hypothetical protein
MCVGECRNLVKADYRNSEMTLVQEKIYCIVAQPRPSKPTTKEWVRPLWFLFTIGWYVALSVVLPTLLGFWLDSPERFDSHPRFTLIGFFLGTVIAFYGLYKMLRRFYTEQKEQEKEKGKEQK